MESTKPNAQLKEYQNTKSDSPFSFELLNNGSKVQPKSVQVEVEVRENHAQVKVTNNYDAQGSGSLQIRKPDASIPTLVSFTSNNKETKLTSKAFLQEDKKEDDKKDEDKGNKEPESKSYEQDGLAGNFISAENVPLNSTVCFTYLTRLKLEDFVRYTLTLSKELYSNAENNALNVKISNSEGVSNLNVSDESAKVDENNSFSLNNVNSDLTVTYEKANPVSTSVTTYVTKSDKDARLIYLRINPKKLFYEKNSFEPIEVPEHLNYEEAGGIVHYFTLDRSSDMVERLQVALNHFEFWLSSLPSGSFFNVVSYGEDVKFLYEEPQEVNDETTADAIEKVNNMGANMNTRNFDKLLEEFKKLLLNDDYAYSSIANRVYILSDGIIRNSTSAFVSLELVTGMSDIRFYYLGIGKYLDYDVQRGFATEGNGMALGVNADAGGNVDNNDIGAALGEFIMNSLKPYVKQFGVTVNGKKDEIKENADNRTVFSKIRDLDQEIELITKVKATKGLLTLAITFEVYEGTTVEEQLKVNIPEVGDNSQPQNEFIDQLYNYKRALEVERLYSGPLAKCDQLGAAVTEMQGDKKTAKLAVYLNGAIKFTENFDVTMTIDTLKNEVAKKLGHPANSLTFNVKDAPVDFTGSIDQNLGKFEERLDVVKAGGAVAADLDNEILKKAKDGMWEFNQELFGKMGYQPQDWEKIKALATQNNAKLGGGFSDFTGPVTNALFTLYVISYLKAKFPKSVPKFAPIFAKSTAGLVKSLKGFNPGVLNTFPTVVPIS